jgi:hypothetical protein
VWPRTPLRENALQETKPQQQRPENYPNGREGPTFSAFGLPKRFVGSLPTSSTSCLS